MLARCFIRNERTFLFIVKVLFFVIATLTPFALFEALTGKAIFLQIFGTFAQTFPNVDMDPRMGLERAQVVFEHPILFGIFSSSVFGLSFFVLHNKKTPYK